jgi:hypothetical protein
MQTTFALAALAGVAYAMPQAVTSAIAPTASAPAGCSSTYNGDFQITVINGTTVAKRDLNTRQAQCGKAGLLTVKLADGKLTDSQSRTGYIASNYQFQFDGPPQAGAIYTSGFSVCGNGSLALGGSNYFYQCKSGDFANLYDRSWAAQCEPVFINVLPCGSSGPTTAVGQQSDGQPTATTAAQAPPVTQISDGQVQGTTAIPVSEFTDGQPQVMTSYPAPVSQISDGQVQATTAASGIPVSQISDGQVQATTAASGVPVSQISDGQVQATTVASGVPVSQISDGQVQATTAAGVPVSQISDGQIQATASATASGTPISQIGDGQIQTNATQSPVPFTGSANGLTVIGSTIAAAFGMAAVLLL